MNEIDFNKIIFKTYKEIEKDPDLLSFMGKVKEKIKDNIDKKLVVDKVLNELFSNLSETNSSEKKSLFEIYKKAFKYNIARSKLGRLKFSMVESMLENSNKIEFRPELHDFNTSSIELIKDFDYLKSVNLKENSIYFINSKKSKEDKPEIIIYEKKGKNKVKKEINLSELTKDQNSIIINEGYEELNNYLKSLFDKKIMEYELYMYVIEQMKKANEVSTLGFMLDFFKRFIMFLNMVYLLILKIKNKKTLDKNDILEGIIMADPFILPISKKIRDN